MGFDLSGYQIADNNPSGLAVYKNQIHHFPAGEHLNLAGSDLPAQGTVCSKEKLLTRLASCVKRP